MRFFVNCFPIVHWLPKYKLREWAAGDLVSGVTVGVVNIPQSELYFSKRFHAYVRRLLLSVSFQKICFMFEHLV